MHPQLFDTTRDLVRRYREASARSRHLFLSGREEARELRPPDGLFHPELPGRLREHPRPDDAQTRQRDRRLQAELYRLYVGRELEDLRAKRLEDEVRGELELPDGEQLNALQARLQFRSEARPARRAALYEALSGLDAEAAPRLLEATVAASWKQARAFGHDGPVALHDALLDTGLERLDALALELLRRTADVYHEAVGWLARKRLGRPLEDVQACDLPWLFAGPPAFAARGRDALVGALCRGIGLDPAAGGAIVHDDEARAKRLPVSEAIAWRPPERVVLLHRPRAGLDDAREHFALLGCCLASTSAESWYQYEETALEDPSFALAAGLLLRGVLCEPAFLRRVTEESASELRFAAAAGELFAARKAAAELHFELLAYDKDTPEDLHLLYPEVLRTSLGVSAPPHGYVDGLAPGLPRAMQLRARLLASMTRTHLVHYFDADWFRNPRSGAFLQGLWKDDGLGGMQQTIEQLDYSALRVEDLCAFFEHAF